MKKRPTQNNKPSALDKRRDSSTPDMFADALPTTTPATWPREGTRAHHALLALLKGPQNQADYSPGWRLAAYIQDLEYLGWHIRSRMFKHPRCPNPIAKYSIDFQDPATAAAIELHRQRTREQGDALLEFLLALILLAPLAVYLLGRLQ